MRQRRRNRAEDRTTTFEALPFDDSATRADEGFTRSSSPAAGSREGRERRIFVLPRLQLPQISHQTREIRQTSRTQRSRHRCDVTPSARRDAESPSGVALHADGAPSKEPTELRSGFTGNRNDVRRPRLGAVAEVTGRRPRRCVSCCGRRPRSRRSSGARSSESLTARRYRCRKRT